MKHAIGYVLVIIASIAATIFAVKNVSFIQTQNQDLTGRFLTPNSTLEVRISSSIVSSNNVKIFGRVTHDHCSELTSVLIPSDSTTNYQSISSRIFCDGIGVKLAGFFADKSNSTPITIDNIKKDSVLKYTITDIYHIPSERNLPLICFIFINILIAGALGGLMFHLAAGIEHRVQIFIPFTRVTVTQSDGTTIEQPKSLEPTLIADAFAGSIAALLTMSVVYSVTSFTVDPLLISTTDCQLHREAGTSIDCSVGAVFRTWIILYGISILGGFGGLRLVAMFSKELMKQLQKKIKENEHEIEKTQDSVESIKSAQKEQLASLYYYDGYQKQEKGFHSDAIKYFKKALGMQTLAKHWSSLGYSQSYLTTENAFTDALDSIAKGFALVDDNTDDGVKYALNYNRACISHLHQKKVRGNPETYLENLIKDLNAAFDINPSQFKIDLQSDIRPGGDLNDLFSSAIANQLPTFKSAIERYFEEPIENLAT